MLERQSLRSGFCKGRTRWLRNSTVLRRSRYSSVLRRRFLRQASAGRSLLFFLEVGVISGAGEAIRPVLLLCRVLICAEQTGFESVFRRTFCILPARPSSDYG